MPKPLVRFFFFSGWPRRFLRLPQQLYYCFTTSFVGRFCRFCCIHPSLSKADVRVTGVQKSEHVAMQLEQEEFDLLMKKLNADAEVAQVPGLVWLVPGLVWLVAWVTDKPEM